MSIFQREGADAPNHAVNPSRSTASSPGGKQPTVVAAGSRVQGEISGATDVLIDGQVEGQLVLGNSVVVGQGGEVQGRIQARRVEIGGKVHGDIKASERIEVLASGRIEGDVSAPRVAINAGAFFKGQVEMTSDASAAQATPEPTAASAPSPPPEQKQLNETGSGSPTPSAAKS